MGEYVEWPMEGQPGRGYLARPEAPGPALIVIQEWWGLVPHIEEVCDRYAAEGYLALAPDMYHGQVAGEPDEARKLAMTMDLNRAGLELQSAVTFLQGHELSSTRKVAVTGFCMGGALAYMLASLAPSDISAVAPFYGAMPWPDFKPDWDRIAAPIEGHYAEHDHAYPLERARELEADLAALGKDVLFHYYPGTSHAFFNPTRPEAFDATAAETSWRRTLAFLARTAA